MGQSSSKQKPSFHKNHGQDVLLNEEHTAVRVENNANSWSNGLVLTSEPIKTNQKIYFKLVVVSRDSHDVVSVGFTSQNPAENNQDETNSWTCSLSKYFCLANTIVWFFVDPSGTIHYGRTNGPEFKVLSKNVDTSRPFWAVFHIWNEPTAIQLLSQNEVRGNVFRMDDEVDLGTDCKEERGRKNVKDSANATDYSEDNEMCVICCAERLQVVFTPCGHLCTCWKCAGWVQQHDNLCPICRETIGSVVRFYKS